MSTHVKRPIRSFIKPLVILAALGVAIWLIHGHLGKYNYEEIRDSLRRIPRWHIVVSILLAAANYITLIGYDWLALQSIGRDLSLGRMALASFTGFVASFNFGALLGGTSVRTRLYTHWGLSAVEIAQLLVQVAVTFWLGVFALAGLAMLVEPVSPFLNSNWNHTQLRILGLLLLSVVLGWFVLAGVRKQPLGWRSWQLSLPRPGIAVAQVVVAAIDLCLAAGCLYVLLPEDTKVGFLNFVTIYCLALLAVILTHVPGGVGVFEATILALTGTGDRVQMLGTLLAFRVIYYLLPLGLAIILLAVNEVAIHSKSLRTSWKQAGRWLEPIVPSVLAGGVAMCGAALMFSSAVPALQYRLTWLDQRLPRWVLELSHFANSLVGMGLLLSASGLQRRLQSGWRITTRLLVAGIAFSLLKGLDIEEAALLALALALLWPSRSVFYRQGAMLRNAFTPSWITTILVVFLCMLWLGYISYRKVPYAPDLWWTVALDGHAPRFLRASVGAAALVLGVFVLNLISPHQPRPDTPTEEDLATAASIVGGQSESWPNVALLGDKALLFNPTRTAFLAYGVQGRTWVVMGDPVGPQEEFAELIWQFRALCDSYSGRPVFYQVHPDHLSIYLDQGLTLLKLGEDGRVRVAGFTLDGGQRSHLRNSVNRLDRLGCEFEVVPPSAVPALLPELRAISDDWLASKATTEKGFSLGYFDARYLSRFPVALVRQGGRIVAFANVWQSGNTQELSPDLMRYTSDAPSGTMEYLFVKLIFWGKDRGYQYMNLGMAPLSGIDDRPLAPLWNKAVGIVYRHGQHFYSFEGLRNYKERFTPEWTPRYLASPGGLELPRIITDLTRLISFTRSRGDQS